MGDAGALKASHGAFGRADKPWGESGLCGLGLRLLWFVLSQSISSLILVKIPAFRK